MMNSKIALLCDLVINFHSALLLNEISGVYHYPYLIKYNIKTTILISI